MMCYLQTVYCVLIIQIVLEVIKCDNIVFLSNTPNEIGDNCTISYNNTYITSIGKCTFISDCPMIKFNLNRNIYNHTICGYVRFEQIVCCPYDKQFTQLSSNEITPILQTIETVQLEEPLVEVALIQSPLTINKAYFNAAFDCILNENFDKGVLKFVGSCPEYNRDVAPQEVCDYDICKDLVCCPVKQSQKLKPKCRFVDDPIDEIRNRLHLNMACTVKGTTQVGRFQHVCDAIAPNQTVDQTEYACNNNACRNWYCCPITKQTDKVYCIWSDSLNLMTLNLIGPKCIDSKSGKTGTCRKAIDCPGFHDDLDMCGTRCCANFYCCPDVDYSGAPVSQQMCANYLSAAYKETVLVNLQTRHDTQEVCSDISLPVTGASRTKPGEYPHMAALGYIPDDIVIYWNCAGSLISDKYILTAARCLSLRSYGPVKTVRLGAILLNKVKRIDDCPEDYTVAEIIPHPGFNSKQTYHDLGLIRLDREVQFNFHVRPICLPGSPEIPQYLFGMGWGLRKHVEENTGTLVQVLFEQYTHNECNQLFQFEVNRGFPNGILEETQICARSRNTIESTCSDDSGGLLLNMHDLLPRMHTVYAITSSGQLCGFADKPNVFTKVYPYIEWIERVVWNYEY